MTRALIATTLILATLGGCGSIAKSRLNPFTWFSGSTSQTLDPGEGYDAASRDRRPLIDQVTALSVERTPGGAIVRATGLPPQQGYFEGDLVSLTGGEPVDGRLEFQFRAIPPLAPTRVSTPQSREIVVGRFISEQKLAGVREIRVVAARNARATRR